MTKVSEKDELISIIVPVYNVEKYLSKCILSIINQTYKNLDIILVNDGSKDNCPKICEEWSKKDKRINVINKENGGLSDARNVGIDNAKGKYICFIDSDDYIENDYVEKLNKLITKTNSDIAVTSHNVIYPKIEFKVLNSSEKLEELTKNQAINRLLYGIIDTSAWGKLYKKELFDKIKFPKGKIYEDIATIPLLMLNSKKIVVSNIATYNYIQNPNSISKNKNIDKKMQLIEMTDNVCDILIENDKNFKLACDRRKMYSRLSTLSQYAVMKKVPKEKIKEITSYINQNGRKVLKDKKISKRDRIGIRCALLGYIPYKIFWKIYIIITRKI